MPDIEIAGVAMSKYIAEVSADLALAEKSTDSQRVNRQSFEWLCTLNGYVQISVSTLLSTDDSEFSVRVTLEG